MSKSEFYAGRDLLFSFMFAAVCLWFLDSIMELLWFNPDSQSLGDLLLPLDRPHEMFSRTLLVSTVLVSGGIVSRMYGKLVLSERQARKNEEELRITFRSIGDAVIATDAAGGIARMNRVAEYLTGWDMAEALGRPLQDVFNVINARTGESCKSILEDVLSPNQSYGSFAHRMLISRSGVNFRIADSAAPILNEAGAVLGAVLVFRDITEEFKREEELRKLRNYLSNIIDSMPSVLIGVDAEKRVTQWNASAEKATGITPSEAKGKKLEDVFPRMTDEMDKVNEALKDKKPRLELRKPRKTSEGVRYEDMTVFPLTSNGIEGAVIQISDVTERFNLEQMMIQTEKMMSVGGLAAGMAHEINNPLAAIAGNTQNIRNRIYKDLDKNHEIACKCDVSMEGIRKYLSEREVPEMLEVIAGSCERAATIVSNMLSFSRKSDKQFRRCNLLTLLEKTIDLAANDYDLKKDNDFRQISIVREYDDELPEVLCEENEIQQVFLNLLKNGAEAMYDKNYSHGGPKFTLRARSDGDMVLVEIEDNGTGMPEVVLKRVFEPFFSTKSVGKGTGLGLSVSYFIITDQHGGTMEVQSKPGDWTRFSVRIPVMD